MDFAGLRQDIEAFSIITIYRHLNPDCDASGSQFALKQWITDNWPEKQVYALGSQSCSQGIWPVQDEADESVIKQSLAIILDTANTERIDDGRWQKAAKTIKVDHHPNFTPFGDVMYVSPDYAAVCEILTEFFDSNPDLIFSEKTAEYAYKGLLTDTLCFRTANTTANTLRTAAILAGKGIRIPELNRELFDQTLDEYRFSSFLRANVNLLNGSLAWIKLNAETLSSHGIRAREARNFIDELGHVKEFAVWCIFTEEFKEGKMQWDGSLRSKTLPVNDLAREFNGGGHLNAAGVNHLSEEQVDELIKALDERIRANQ